MTNPLGGFSPPASAPPQQGGPQATDYVASYLKMYAPAPSATQVQVTIPQATQASGQPQFASRNNNPGNLRFAGQQGATQGDGGFARFNSPEEGYTALLSQIQRDQDRGLPLGAFIAKYAPPYENDTAAYVNQIARSMGVSPGTPLSHLPVHALAKFMVQKESGSQVKDMLPIGIPAQPHQGTVSSSGPIPVSPSAAPAPAYGSPHPGSGTFF